MRKTQLWSRKGPSWFAIKLVNLQGLFVLVQACTSTDKNFVEFLMCPTKHYCLTLGNWRLDVMHRLAYLIFSYKV
jgi:hypothetical protein